MWTGSLAFRPWAGVGCRLLLCVLSAGLILAAEAADNTTEDVSASSAVSPRSEEDEEGQRSENLPPGTAET
jgi:hypothetical protein